MKFPPYFFLSCLMLLACHVQAQKSRGDCRIVFYNVENLFDLMDNPKTDDDEFLPGSDRNWNSYRLNIKLTNISKVIVAAGLWSPPEIVGLCEVENRFLVEQLIRSKQLKSQGYKIIHKESPDSRGIDVSMIYINDKFRPLYYNYFGLKDKKGELINTREILYVKGILLEMDTIHLFLNHWPSRYGGYLETVELRKLAAGVLKEQTDSILSRNKNAKMVIMGDFNDQPSNESMQKILKAAPPAEISDEESLVSLSADWNGNNLGTIKYQSLWQVYDQIIVSKELIKPDKGLFCQPQNAGILNESFLFIEDKRYGGLKPHRTFNGFSYVGGYSDHLPVYLDLFFR